MKRGLIIPLFLSFFSFVKSEPIFEEGKRYLITISQTQGALHPGNNLYSLGFTQVSIIPDKMNRNYYWYIRKESSGYYSIRNVENDQYIRYDRSKSDRTSLTFSKRILSDQSTLFAFIPVVRNKSTYYAIRPAGYNDRIWNLRNSTYGNTFFPVGTYGYNMDAPIDNELFQFVDNTGNHVKDNGVKPPRPMSSPSRGNLGSFINQISINGKKLAWDNRKKNYLSILSEDQVGKDAKLQLQFLVKDDANYEIRMEGKTVMNGKTMEINRLSCSKSYPITVLRNGTIVAESSIRFTTFPLVQLYSSQSVSSSYRRANVIVTETDKDSTGEQLWAKLRIRGAMATMMPKKAFAVKLTNEESDPINRSYFGLRSDNSWILDAAYIDPSRVRNRVTTDLWLDFSTPPYYAEREPNMINGTRGRLVEVFLNDSYQGIYVMTEKIDRKQLDIKKFVFKEGSNSVVHRGALFKAVNWSPATLMGEHKGDRFVPFFNNQRSTWASYEMKYPDLGDGEPIEWNALSKAVSLSSYSTSNKNFSALAADYFDLPVFRDYFLLLDLILATDNQGKNIYLSVYDQTQSNKLSITPWDLDGTWGRNWSGSSGGAYPLRSFWDYCTNSSEGMSLLFLRLASNNVDNWNTQLAERYRELRSTFFSYESLIGRFEKMDEMIRLSGANEREMEVWKISPSIDELKFLRTWIKHRLDFLDQQYLGTPYTSDLSNNSSKSLFTAFYQPIDNRIYVVGEKQGSTLRLFNSKKEEVVSHTVRSNPCIIPLPALPSGTYSLKGEGNSVKIII